MRFSYASGATPLDGYTIKRGIGVGGFGEVYFAISDAGKEVALKKIQRNSDVELRGVRQCLNLNHINLISLWDIKTNGAGESWVVMEYVPGVSLRDVIEAFPRGMPESEIKKWFAATAAGVAYLHKHGIVHRDLKPGNIFRDDDQHIVKIGDYGLSKFIACNRRSGQTQAVGTFHYMAPEIGKGEYGKEIDIYALGILLFEMITGDVPFDGESAQEIITKHLTGNVTLEKIPPGFHRAVMKSLHKDPLHRYSSVQAFARELPWGDLATHDSTNSLNPTGFSAAQSNGNDLLPSGYGQAKIAPIFVSGDALKILKEDVEFGEGREQNGDSNNFPEAPSRPITRNPAIHKSTSPHGKGVSESSSLIAKRKTSAGNRSAKGDSVKPEIEWVADEPLGMSHPTIHWWNHGVTATMVKLILVGVAIAFIFLKPAMLLNVALLTGLFFLVNFFRQHGIAGIKNIGSHSFSNANFGIAAGSSPAESDSDSFTSAAGTSYDSVNKQSLAWSGLNSEQLINARSWFARRSARERLTELTGSLLISAISCIVLTAIPFAILASSSTEAAVVFWGRFASACCVSIFACWMILTVGKFWDYGSGTAWIRRCTMALVGLVTGIFGWRVAEFFGVPLSLSASPNQSGVFAIFQNWNIPTLPACLIFFVAMFITLRWWYQVDPFRKTRVNFLIVGLCFVWAVIFSIVLGGPALLQGLLGVVVSTSVQLAAPWVGYFRRKIITTGR